MLPNDPFNLIIAGVGGQGNVLASKIVAKVANGLGYQAAVGDTFGVSQRGGAVMSHVRLSSRDIYGPLIPTHAANVVLGFEPLETLRVLQTYGAPETRVLCNDRPVYPLGVQRGNDSYPAEEIQRQIAALSGECRIVQAGRLAEELGNPKIINMIMVGALVSSAYLPFDPEKFREIIKTFFPPGKVEINLKAFQVGFG